MGVTVLFICSLQTASLTRWKDCKTTCPVWVLLKDCRATRRVGQGASLWTSKIVLDFAYTEQHEMQKQTFDHRKCRCCVRKANPPWNFPRKIQAIMSYKCAKKIKKKNEFLVCSAFADKEALWTPHRQKTCGVRPRGVQTPLYVHLWYLAIAANEAFFCDCYRNTGHFLCSAERIKRFVNVHFIASSAMFPLRCANTQDHENCFTVEMARSKFFRPGPPIALNIQTH